MIARLDDILQFVGTLDDAGGADTPRERFRRYLKSSVGTVGAVRDYVETCLRESGPQYNRALQDLVNHSAQLIGFEVEFGRYRGVAGQIGYDGIWRHGDLAIVVEVKTTDAFAFRTQILLGYVDALISDRKIADWDHALGLYVVGRLDADLKQLEHAIVAERRTHQLRVTSVESLLSLAELVQEGQLSQREAVALLRPVGVLLDDVVSLLARITAKETPKDRAVHETDARIESAVELPEQATMSPGEAPRSNAAYVLTPLSPNGNVPVEQELRQLLDSGWYVFGERTPSRKTLRRGDRICFYVSGVGVVADALVDSSPERRVVPGVHEAEKYPWAFKVKDVRYYFDRPVVIDAALRSNLLAFHGRDPQGPWAWYVQSTHQVKEADFWYLVGEVLPTGASV